MAGREGPQFPWRSEWPTASRKPGAAGALALTLDQLRGCLAILSEQERKVLEMRYRRQWSPAEHPA